jgi:hypothetical protein
MIPGRAAIVLLVLVGWASPGQAADACCQVTAVNPNTQIVTARELASGKTFSFNVPTFAQAQKIKVGQRIHADFARNLASLDGTNFCCRVMELDQTKSTRNDPCGDINQVRALAVTACDLQMEKIFQDYQLERRLQDLETLDRNVQYDRPYYREAITRCAIVDAGMTVLSYAVGKFAEVPQKGEYRKVMGDFAKSYEELKKAKDVLGGNPLPLLGDKGEKAEHALAGADLVKTLFSAARITPEKAAAKIDECAGKMPPKTYDHAKRYVRNLQALVALTSRVAEGRNALRSHLHAVCEPAQARYHKACVAYHNCNKTDAGQCPAARKAMPIRIR